MGWQVRTIRRLSQLPQLVAGITLLFLMVMTFADVMLRSIFNNPLEAATELTRIAVAVVVFTTLPMVAARRQQIVVDLLDPVFPRLASRIRDGLIDMGCGLLLFLPASRIWVLAGREYRHGDMTEYLHIPQFYITYFVLLMTVTTAVVMVANGLLTLLGYDDRRDSSGTGQS